MVLENIVGRFLFCERHRRSMMVALAIPPPSHIVCWPWDANDCEYVQASPVSGDPISGTSHGRCRANGAGRSRAEVARERTAGRAILVPGRR
jgi:hypothetical protein